MEILGRYYRLCCAFKFSARLVIMVMMAMITMTMIGKGIMVMSTSSPGKRESPGNEFDVRVAVFAKTPVNTPIQFCFRHTYSL